MIRDTDNARMPYNMASRIRGLYARVAKQLKVNPSYVSRVARGERRSDEIEASLQRELKLIVAMMKTRRNGSGRNGDKTRRKAKAKNVREGQRV